MNMNQDPNMLRQKQQKKKKVENKGEGYNIYEDTPGN
jgi:hypothetical protein